MKQILRAFLFLLLFTATVNTAIADEKANVTKQGTVRGRIIDATKQTLPGASIYIEKLHTGVTSDVNGFYTFSNLDPGTYTVKVSYVGYSPVELKITIPAGRTLEKDVVLNEGVELQEVVVGGAFQGQRRAINSQKNNMGITNVVSADCRNFYSRLLERYLRKLSNLQNFLLPIPSPSVESSSFDSPQVIQKFVYTNQNGLRRQAKQEYESCNIQYLQICRL